MLHLTSGLYSRPPTDKQFAYPSKAGQREVKGKAERRPKEGQRDAKGVQKVRKSGPKSIPETNRFLDLDFSRFWTIFGRFVRPKTIKNNLFLYGFVKFEFLIKVGFLAEYCIRNAALHPDIHSASPRNSPERKTNAKSLNLGRGNQ